MKKKVFVDGLSGTTGLKIHERLSLYSELDMITIDYEKRRDPAERARCLNEADIVFLCLPDDAAKEAVSLVTNPNTKIIDASTAHRTSKDWAYGLPELSKEHREAVINGKRVSNPGCHATAFALSVYPLIFHGIMPTNYPVSCQSLTGYSGGGKALIEKYEADGEANPYTTGPRPYSLTFNHKHLPEMTMRTGLQESPIFLPVLNNVYQGLAVSVPIHTKLLNKRLSVKEIHELMSEHYCKEKFVKVMPYGDDTSLFDGGLDITACNHTNQAEVFVFGNDAKGSIVIYTRLDNLGKGASGAAIQNMNLMLGFDEDLHLLD
ncbi:N-acetyl-gamma-glutamyl-phosphate reductase [Mobilitalea sibirica]|uniref:N-acetyl-gamma-glutamyl-phosphate reductase n=1 Tax=Mobilitalea sibirica TaxID=1462919 RepID=A0A8J7H0E8_9FIRM|nr:N-acetyl-gamma-glutamyl-phosphate reductase [Mobilitalea sibirica]MBH1939512.1 N-acetyl-gamma-glutamyl-phosphate reductase [Mobilitalea sibirica]